MGRGMGRGGGREGEYVHCNCPPPPPPPIEKIVSWKSALILFFTSVFLSSVSIFASVCLLVYPFLHTSICIYLYLFCYIYIYIYYIIFICPYIYDQSVIICDLLCAILVPLSFNLPYLFVRPRRVNCLFCHVITCWPLRVKRGRRHVVTSRTNQNIAGCSLSAGMR